MGIIRSVSGCGSIIIGSAMMVMVLRVLRVVFCLLLKGGVASSFTIPWHLKLRWKVPLSLLSLRLVSSLSSNTTAIHQTLHSTLDDSVSILEIHSYQRQTTPSNQSGSFQQTSLCQLSKTSKPLTPSRRPTTTLGKRSKPRITSTSVFNNAMVVRH